MSYRSAAFVSCPYCGRNIRVQNICGVSPSSCPPIRGFGIKDHRCNQEEQILYWDIKSKEDELFGLRLKNDGLKPKEKQ